VIFSVFFWSLLLGGLLGALLAVPLTAAIKVLFRRYLWERRLEPAVDKRFGPIGKSDDDEPAGVSETGPEPA
jgi:predicted PurR-regulated permease PerM